MKCTNRYMLENYKYETLEEKVNHIEEMKEKGYSVNNSMVGDLYCDFYKDLRESVINELTQEQYEILTNLPTKQIVRVEYRTMTQEEIVELLNKHGKNDEN